jgi:hypothetical protein
MININDSILSPSDENSFHIGDILDNVEDVSYINAILKKFYGSMKETITYVTSSNRQILEIVYIVSFEENNVC